MGMITSRAPLLITLPAVVVALLSVLFWLRPGPMSAGPSSTLSGDVNCDGAVNSIDAALVLQYGAGLVDALECQQNADANADGSIDSIDAALILQQSAGLLHAAPPATPIPNTASPATATPSNTPPSVPTSLSTATATPGASATLPSCGTGNAMFSVSPVELSDFMGLVPLGNIAPPGHVFPTDHIYFHINRVDPSRWELGTIEVPVVAPGDIWVTEISSTRRLPDGVADYVIRFSPCRDVFAFFIHVTSLSQALGDAFSPPYDRCEEHIAGEVTYQSCSKSVELHLPAGSPVGTAGGNDIQNALDLGVYDLRTSPLPYANQDRWTDQTLYIACPVDYFTVEVRDALRARLGAHDNSLTRTTAPVCGEVEQDEPGTAQGVWFAAGTGNTYPEDRHLALIHDNVDPAKGVFSVGTSAASSGLPSNAYYFDPAGSGLLNRDFIDVATDGSLYCYETNTRFGEASQPFVLLIQLTSPTTLRLERLDSTACGDGPWQFTSAQTNYER